MYSAPFLLLVSSAKTRNRLHPLPLPRRTLCKRTAKLSRYDSETLPLLMISCARRCSYPRLTKERMMQMEKIHLATSKGMAGWISEDHLLKTRSWTAVKVSTAYTASDIVREMNR